MSARDASGVGASTSATTVAEVRDAVARPKRSAEMDARDQIPPAQRLFALFAKTACAVPTARRVVGSASRRAAASRLTRAPLYFSPDVLNRRARRFAAARRS